MLEDSSGDVEVWVWTSDKARALPSAGASRQHGVRSNPSTLRFDAESTSREAVAAAVSVVCTGSGSVVVVTSAGHALGWGENSYGELGLGHKEPVTLLTRLHIGQGGCNGAADKNKNNDNNNNNNN
eukprot:PhM_4_TR5512/c0_g1_i1/m.101464